MYLGKSESHTLIHIARETISTYVRTGALPQLEVKETRLQKPGAAFVTIRKNGLLRGCIGYTEEVYPLYRTVMECAVSSATEDPRFPPIEESELEDIEIEISVLTPLEEVKDISSILVGKHGLMVRKGTKRGLLLPQVPVEYGWDLPAFLSHTCVKAGLLEDEWKKGVEIYSFEAQIIDE